MKLHRLVPLVAALLTPLHCFAAPKIGVLLKGHSAFWEAVAKGATSTGEKLGVETLVKMPPSETAVAIQIALLHALAAQNISALVIAPTNKDSLAQPVAELAAKGVKIIVIDSPLSGNSPVAFVGTDQRAAGAAGGALVATLVSDTDEVAFLRHNQSGGATQLRELGAMEKLHEAHPNLVIHGDIYASTEDGVETERSELLLSKYPNAKAIFASGSPGTLAMMQVLAARKPEGRAKLVGCGFNLSPEVVKGLQSGALTGWIAQLPEDIGSKGVQAASDALSGKPVPDVIPTDFLVVTKDNLNDPKVQALLTL